MKLTHDFHLSEFTTSAGIVITPTEEQIFCIHTLAKDILQPIRDRWGRLTITSGLRNIKSYKELIRQGYPASKTSDHFAWCKAKPTGTGAADFTVYVYNLKNVFDWVIDNLYYKCGQIIYYPNKHIIHVSNRFDKIFKMPDPRDDERRLLIYENGSFNKYIK